MPDEISLTNDVIAGSELAAMNAKDRVEKAQKAHDMHIRGKSTRQIAAELQVAEPTATELVQEELYRSQVNRPNPERLARARMQYIIGVATEILDSGQLHPKAQNYPALLRAVLEAQDKLDKYDGIEQPERKEVTHVTLADLVREAEAARKNDAGPLTIEHSPVLEVEPGDVLQQRPEDDSLGQTEGDSGERAGQSDHDGSVV